MAPGSSAAVALRGVGVDVGAHDLGAEGRQSGGAGRADAAPGAHHEGAAAVEAEDRGVVGHRRADATQAPVIAGDRPSAVAHEAPPVRVVDDAATSWWSKRIVARRSAS